MTQLQNQFNQSQVLGQLDLQHNGNVISAQIDVSSAGGLVPGQPVKLVDTANGIPLVVEAGADTDDIFGYIQYGIRNSSYGVGDHVSIALVNGGAAMYLNSNAAIARGANVKAVIGTPGNVATATTGTTIVGRALDKATAANQLIRVLMLPGKQVSA